MPIVLEHESYMDKFFEWSRDYEDKDGTWSWGEDRDWGDETRINTLEPFLRICEAKKWSEIRQERYYNKSGGHYKHIFYFIAQLEQEAIARLIELELDDYERIFRFRIDRKKRLYGFVMNQVFGTVWYDPHHNIYRE